MNNTCQIAVAILNYNGLNLLKQFLPQVIFNSPKSKFYVIDNGSSDGSVRWIKTNFQIVEIITLHKNIGYAGGYNQGVKQIKEPLICFLNNDVEVSNSWLEPIIDEFYSNTELVVAQPLILDFKKPKYFEYAGAGGGYLDFFGFPYCRGRIFNRLKKCTSGDNKTQSIFWASGACFFVKRDFFIKMGGFDEDFFCYQEEIDFCWRAKRSGHHIATIGQSHVHHLGSGSSKKPETKVFYNHRNSLMMLFKNASLGYLIVILPSRLLMDFFIGVFYLFQLKSSSFRAVIYSHWSFFRKCSILIKKRKTLKKYPYIKHFNKLSVLILYLTDVLTKDR